MREAGLFLVDVRGSGGISLACVEPRPVFVRRGARVVRKIHVRSSECVKPERFRLVDCLRVAPWIVLNRP